jgi:YfiH family protein
MLAETSFLRVDWQAPACVGALMSTRLGGHSSAPWDGLNLGDHVGDDSGAVARNRQHFSAAVGCEVGWLRQAHAAAVVPALATLAGPFEADASWADAPGVACAVLVADCLPVLLAADNGRAVGAVHAGWRGLGAGVIEAAVERVAAAAACGAHRLVAWLGPCIGPARFEVGPEVVDALGGGPAFQPSAGSSRPDRYLADLPMLARERLRRLGIERVAGGTECTATLPQRYYSHRRDGITGRMAAAVWLKR